jgi:hypothetical protein
MKPDAPFSPFYTTPGRRLKIVKAHDPFKQWWSLDELRFCKKCEHLFIGREIQIFVDQEENYHFHCPTRDCESSWEHWEYPELHL